MTNDGAISPAPPSPAPNRLSARGLLALLIGRDAVPAPGAADDGGPRACRRNAAARLPLQLFVLSFLMLFVELALIRWSGALVIYLSYFSNFVLLGSFLGIGIGFLRARSRVNLFPWSPVALALLILFVRAFPVEVIRTGQPAPVLRLRDVPCQRPAHVGHAAHRVPGRRRRHGDDRRGRRPDVRPVPAAGRLPAGHRGQHRRHRGLLAALVPRRQTGRLGAHRRAGHAAALRPGESACSRSPRSWPW